MKNLKMNVKSKSSKKVITDPLGRKIVYASQDKVKKLHPWTDFILFILGHPEALISDESYLSDFFSFGKESKTAKTKFCKKLGFHTDSDKIIDIAEQLKSFFQGRYPTKTRKLITGQNVLEFDKMIKMKAIESRCPDKWHFVDAETGDVWMWDWQKETFIHSPFEKKIVQVLKEDVIHGWTSDRGFFCGIKSGKASGIKEKITCETCLKISKTFIKQL